MKPELPALLISEIHLKRILIADDSDIVRDRLTELLNDVADEIEIAHDAPETLDKVEEFKPDYVILDIRMPGNGVSIIQKIKAFDCSPVVIMYTNFPYEQYRTKCMEAGADYFFDKSSGAERIIDVLRTAG